MKAVLLISAVFSVFGSCMLDPNPAEEDNNNGNATPQIIIDHRSVELYDDIPDEYIAAVKKMWFDLPGESHSFGYRRGLALLANQDSRYPASVTESGDPEAYTDAHLRASMATFGDQYHGTDTVIYYYGEEDWFTYDGARTKTKAHLDYANTNGLAIAAFGFGWCWDMLYVDGIADSELDPVYKVHWYGYSYSGPEGNLHWGLDAGDQALTGNSVSMDTYLQATQEYADYCAEQGYDTKVFFTTGPVDNDIGNAENKYQRELKHDYIRAYVAANSKRILFDYADILAWNDAGEEHREEWTDGEGMAHSYQAIHADNTADIPGNNPDNPAGLEDHIGDAGALRLGKAVWVLLARMAGWDGK